MDEKDGEIVFITQEDVVASGSGGCSKEGQKIEIREVLLWLLFFSSWPFRRSIYFFCETIFFTC